jgi:tRNA(Arg) A34 adenosine deaminase TadA
MPHHDESDATAMQRALTQAQHAIDAGQTPFGACIVRDGHILAEAHNNVRAHTDITAHAEVCALRRACAAVGDIHLTGATIYSTIEPCPMCFTAIHWARIGRIVFGGRIADVAAFGFNEMPITNDRLKALAQLDIEIHPDCGRDDALALFERWRDRGGAPY